LLLPGAVSGSAQEYLFELLATSRDVTDEK
jgi:hypothetical protein